MSLVSFLSLVSLSLWYFLNGIHPTEGSSVSVICHSITCSSENYEYENCELNETVTVVNASVTTIYSRAKCINTHDYRNDDYDDDKIGFYGYDDNIFWVDKGCGAKFEICYAEGASFHCNYSTCSSEAYKLQKCVVTGDVKIVNISVDDTLSRTICVNAQDYQSDDNKDIGFYGYNENIFWVDKGCSAKFEICYTVRSSALPTSTSPTAESSSFTYSSSIISSPPTTLSEMFTTESGIDLIATPATETTRETSSPTTEFYGSHSQTQKQHQEDSSDTTIVIIVVALVAGVLVLGIIGIILCRIRYTRRKENESVLDDKTERIPHTAPVFISPNGYKTQLVKTSSDVSAETRCQVNAYNSILNAAAGQRKEINENQELKGNKRPIPAKRRAAKDNAKTVTKCDKEVKSSKNNPVGVNDTVVRDEQTEQNDEYLEPVSNRSSLEESHDYIELQQEANVYDDIDPNYVPDT